MKLACICVYDGVRWWLAESVRCRRRDDCSKKLCATSRARRSALPSTLKQRTQSQTPRDPVNCASPELLCPASGDVASVSEGRTKMWTWGDSLVNKQKFSELSTHPASPSLKPAGLLKKTSKMPRPRRDTGECSCQWAVAEVTVL